MQAIAIDHTELQMIQHVHLTMLCSYVYIQLAIIKYNII